MSSPLDDILKDGLIDTNKARNEIKALALSELLKSTKDLDLADAESRMLIERLQTAFKEW